MDESPIRDELPQPPTPGPLIDVPPETEAVIAADAPQKRGVLHPVTLTDYVRRLTQAVLTPLGVFLHRRGVHPDHITVAGTLLVVAAAVLVGAGYLQAGALLLLVGLPFDAVDGAVARAMQRSDRFGAMLDSALDRYADAVIFAGLGYYFADRDQLELLVLAFAALVGSYSVSYVRARAEGLGVDVKVGLFSRLERIAIILIMLFVPQVLPAGLVILAIGTNVTGVQRLVYVYRVLKQREV